MGKEEGLYPSQVERRQTRSLKAKRIATRGEDLACAFLQGKSFQLLARNYRAGRAGEIDIVAMDPDYIVTFVEVKTRSFDNPVFGIPELGFEAVGYSKQRKILLAAQSFMAKPQFSSLRWRFDVIVVGIPRQPPDAAPEITHVVDAFK